MASPAKLSGKPLARARGAYLLAVLLGSYGVIWMFTGGAGVALLRLGLARSEAVISSSLLGLLLYPALVILAFAVQRPLRLWGLLAALSLLLGMLGRSGGAA